ncbi:MAG: hypothetical protein QF886_03085, partial [Planctomycetota bacterium]|nr:hypothetical protein [Planctomycetota bacterium]
MNRTCIQIVSQLAFMALPAFCFSEAVMTQGDAVRTSDLARTATRVDISPNSKSAAIEREFYRPLLKSYALKQEGAKYGLSIFPRSRKYAGLLVTTPDGKPLERKAAKSITIEVLPPESKANQQGKTITGIRQWADSRYWYCVAAPIHWPACVLVLREGKSEILRGKVDFSKISFDSSDIQFPSLLSDIDKRGFVRAKDGDYIADDGTRL